ncbi:CYB protein, partial [Acromyrmex insinuator]
NFGSLLDIFLIIQIIRGLFLSIHYCPNISIAFNRIIHIIQNVPTDICIYFYVRRNIYYNSVNIFTLTSLKLPTHIQPESRSQLNKTSYVLISQTFTLNYFLFFIVLSLNYKVKFIINN